MKVLIRGNPGGKEITMAEVNWINGKIAPPESGEYYVILEATEAWDSVKAEERAVMAGEIEMTGDWYDTEEGCFQTIGKGNPFWRVLAWADILKPDVPEDIKPKLSVYFGQAVKWEDGKWNRRAEHRIHAADVAPVVHCKDCVYSRPAGKNCEDMVLCTNLSKYCLYMMKSDFCGDGIFKEAPNGSDAD